MKKLLLFGMMAIALQSYSQTNISGGIYDNTKWTKVNSPYIVSGQLVIFQGVTLNIEPGVTIRFENGAGINVRGSLVANGTRKDSIIFTSNAAAKRIGSWNGLLMNQPSVLEVSFCSFSHAGNLLSYNAYGKYSLKNCRFYNNTFAFYATDYADMYIDSCEFAYNTTAVNYNLGYSYITNCQFFHNDNAVISAHVLKNNLFEYNNVAVGGDGAYPHIVQNNIFKNNKIAFYTSIIGSNGEETQISQNTIYNNDTAFIIQTAYFDETHFIKENQICNNNFILRLTDNNNLDIKNNCFCTDSATVRSKVYDGYTNTSLGLLKFMPFMDGCVTGILDHSTSEGTQVVPNPNSGQFMLKLPEHENYQVKFFNTIGIEVSHLFLIENNEIKMIQPKAGIFYLDLSTENSRSIKKVIVE